jgi:hypothetical protein
MSNEIPSPERAGAEITPPEGHVDGRDANRQASDDRRGSDNRRASKIAGLFPKEFHAQDSATSPFPDDKNGLDAGLPAYEGEDQAKEAVNTAEDLVTRVINVEDDPSLDPWTFRTFFLGSSKARYVHH